MEPHPQKGAVQAGGDSLLASHRDAIRNLVRSLRLRLRHGKRNEAANESIVSGVR